MHELWRSAIGPWLCCRRKCTALEVGVAALVCVLATCEISLEPSALLRTVVGASQCMQPTNKPDTSNILEPYTQCRTFVMVGSATRQQQQQTDPAGAARQTALPACPVLQVFICKAKHIIRWAHRCDRSCSHFLK